jgi:hypothetical protein
MRGPNWKHQEKEYRQHRSKRSRALFWTMRTGKTKAVLDKACFQYSKGNIKGLIVVAPNGVHVNWVRNEVPKWVWDESNCMAHAWEMSKRADFKIEAKFKALLDHDGFKVFAINMESLRFDDTIKALKQFILSCGNDYMLAISEAHHFGRAGSQRTQKARNLSRKAKFVTVETGTPILNSPLRAYALFKILDADGLIPEALRDLAAKRKAAGNLHGITYEDFVQYFAVIEKETQKARSVRRRAFKKIKEYKNLDELRELMSPFTSVVMRDEVDDMPELIRLDRPVVMSEKQRRYYLDMVARHLVEIGDDMITATDGGPRMMKLQQILNGYILDTEMKKVIEIDPDAPIYDALVEQVEGTLPHKSLIWCRYREDIRRCVAKLEMAFGKRILQFHGGVPNGQREGIREAFNTDPKYIALVGQPGAGGEGRDFSGAHTIITFSSTPNAIHDKQGEERGTVKGGHDVTLVRLRTYGTVDDRNWEICDGKYTVADSVSGHGLRELLRATDV